MTNTANQVAGTTELCYLTVLEAGSPRCRQSHIPSEGSSEGSFLPLAASGGCLQSLASLACRCIIPSLYSRHHVVFSPRCLQVQTSLFWEDTRHCVRAHPDPVWCHPDFITSAKTLFPNKVPGLRAQTHLCADGIHPTSRDGEHNLRCWQGGGASLRAVLCDSDKPLTIFCPQVPPLYRLWNEEMGSSTHSPPSLSINILGFHEPSWIPNSSTRSHCSPLEWGGEERKEGISCTGSSHGSASW